MELSELLIKYILLQKEYIKLLGKELDELAILGSIHHWKSTRISEGVAFRTELTKMKGQIKEQFNINLLND